MPLRYSGSVSIFYICGEAQHTLKAAIDPAHSSNIIMENFSLSEKAEDHSEEQSKLTGPELGSYNLVGPNGIFGTLVRSRSPSVWRSKKRA
jgi:hypothetical protein